MRPDAVLYVFVVSDHALMVQDASDVSINLFIGFHIFVNPRYALCLKSQYAALKHSTAKDHHAIDCADGRR